VYCEYESDHNGTYTVVAGCAVDRDGAVPGGMKKVTIDAGNFVICDAKGELPNSVFAAWAEIWNAPLDRRCQADVDRYDEDGQVSVHVGVR
jgi:predicted transcriptional regulator YdeE